MTQSPSFNLMKNLDEGQAKNKDNYDDDENDLQFNDPCLTCLILSFNIEYFHINNNNNKMIKMTKSSLISINFFSYASFFE